MGGGCYFVVEKVKKKQSKTKQNKTGDLQEDSGQFIEYAPNLTMNN